MYRLLRNGSSFGETRRQSWQGTSGFTLTELLVTMAIITLLLGLLISVVNGVGPDDIRAMKDLQTVYIALVSYTQDHEGSFPKVINWAEADQQVRKALEPYLGEKFISTADPIGWRYGPDPKRSLDSVKLHQIRNPSRVPIAGEPFQELREGEKVSVLFADGHVERLAQEELSILLMSSIDEGRTTGGVTLDDNGDIHIQF